MKYLLDTNICIYLIKQRPFSVLEKFASVQVGEIGISAISVAELQYGVQQSQHPAQNEAALEQFLLPLLILPFDEQAAASYGRIRAFLQRQGTPIGSLDMLIAAQALSLNAILVTNNEVEFARVPDIRLENWSLPGMTQ